MHPLAASLCLTQMQNRNHTASKNQVMLRFNNKQDEYHSKDAKNVWVTVNDFVHQKNYYERLQSYLRYLV